ncbi:hypothetical protein LguiA_007481 [Lonicera macranthoides]
MPQKLSKKQSPKLMHEVREQRERNSIISQEERGQPKVLLFKKIKRSHQNSLSMSSQRFSPPQHQPSAIILASMNSHFRSKSSTRTSTIIQVSRSSHILSRSSTLNLYPNQ